MKKVMMIVLSSAIIFSACKKDNDMKTTQDKIMGVWKITSFVDNSYVSGQLHTVAYTGQAGDNADFRTDGKAYYSLYSGAYHDTATYSVYNDRAILLNGLYTDITTLNDSVMNLHSKYPFEGNYYESTIYLKK